MKFDQFDTDKSGAIEYPEFDTWTKFRVFLIIIVFRFGVSGFGPSLGCNRRP